MDTSRPVIPVAVEHSDIDILIHPDGSKRSAANITLTPDDMGAMRAGYVCCRCFERFEAPFPKNCWVCGFPCSDKQAEFIAKAYVGEVWIGPRTSVDEEHAIAREMVERERHAKKVSQSSIVVPRGDWRNLIDTRG